MRLSSVLLFSTILRGVRCRRELLSGPNRLKPRAKQSLEIPAITRSLVNADETGISGLHKVIHGHGAKRQAARVHNRERWVQEVAEPVTETRGTREGVERRGEEAQEGRRLDLSQGSKRRRRSLRGRCSGSPAGRSQDRTGKAKGVALGKPGAARGCRRPWRANVRRASVGEGFRPTSMRIPGESKALKPGHAGEVARRRKRVQRAGEQRPREGCGSTGRIKALKMEPQERSASL